MNRKNIRTIIITALILLIAVTAILKLDIEPANQSENASVVSTPTEEVSQKNQLELEKSVEVQSTKDKKTEEVKSTETTKQIEEQPAVTVAETPATPSLNTQQHFCTIEIRCDTVADTSKLENQAVAPYVPQNGVVLAAAKIEYTPGESVFDILLRATKEKNIHMEFRDDNLYSGKYIEGINYLYELDGGPLSGWMYKVNSKFPNYGCAAYQVKDGDAIVWVYTCDLGVDVGDNSTW